MDTAAFVIALLSFVIAIGSLIFTILAYLKIIKQTEYNKNSMNIALKAIQIPNIPRVYILLEIFADLENWKCQVEEVIKHLTESKKTSNYEELKIIASKDYSSHVVKKEIYNCNDYPLWLREMYLSGAKHYYYAFSCIKDIWDSKKSEIRSISLDSVAERFRESQLFLNELVVYLQNMLPDAIVYAPDRKKDESYLI